MYKLSIFVLYRMLYWTDWSTIRPGIYRSSVVSPARETLVTGKLVWPNALTIDFTSNYTMSQKTKPFLFLE